MRLPVKRVKQWKVRECKGSAVAYALSGMNGGMRT